MPIVVNIDVMMAKRKMSAKDLAKEVGITPANLSVLKTGKSQGRPVLHSGRSVQSPGVPARRSAGIPQRTVMSAFHPQERRISYE